MSKRSDRLLLNDALEAILDIEHFTNGMKYEEFTKDTKTHNAVLYSLTIIGEAVNKLSNDFIQSNPSYEWRKVISFGNRIIHDYFGVDYNLVWDVIKNNLTDLKLILLKILAENNNLP